MAKLTKEAKERIRQAVQKAEKSTSGEFVTVIAKKSDDYLHIPLLWASVLSLLVPVIFLFILKIHNGFLIFNVQAATLVFFFLVLQIDFLKMLFVPRAVKQLRARRNAYLQFYEQGVSNTKDRSGILLFVSMAERYVEIIADEGINKKVDGNFWEIIVNEFILKVKENRIEEGFIDTIEKCSEILSRHFPIKPNDKNELSDHLIEL
jgi:putative membrane protein